MHVIEWKVLRLRSELAKKSKVNLLYAVLGESILIIVLLYLASTYEFKFSNMSQDDRSALLILAASALVYFFWALPILLIPNIRIEYDEKGIYIRRIGNKEYFIPFKEISKVDLRLSRGKYLNTKAYGKLIVCTKEKNYGVYHIENVEQVKNELQRLISKHKMNTDF